MEKFETEKEIKMLFNKLNLRYLNRNEMIFPEIGNYNFYKSKYYLDNYSEFTQLEVKYGEKLTKWLYQPTYIKKVDDAIGYGLFSAKFLKADDLIGEYTGVIQEAHNYNPSDEEIDLKTEYAWDYPDEIPGFPPLEINARYAGGVLRFVNHSFTPNLRIEHAVINNEWKIFFVADEDIQANVELFVDYGDAYWAVESREIII